VVALVTESGIVMTRDLATGKVIHALPGSYAGYWIREVSIAGHSALLLGAGDERFLYGTSDGDQVLLDVSQVLDQAALAALQHPLQSSRATVNSDSPLTSVTAQGLKSVRVRPDGLITNSWIGGKRGAHAIPLKDESVDERATAIANVTVDRRSVLAAGTARGEVGLWDLARRALYDVIHLDDPVEHVIPAGPDQLVVIAGGTLHAIKRGGT
jgi:hypothetical protein